MYWSKYEYSFQFIVKYILQVTLNSGKYIKEWWEVMKRIALILTIAVVADVIFVGCCPYRRLTADVRDSIRIETIVRTEHVPDTVFVEVPAEVIRQTVRDTTSHLETSFAISDARILPSGALFHSLENRAQKQPVAAKKKIVYRDSIVYRNRETETMVEVPRSLTWWQQTQIRACWVLLALLLIISRKPIAALVKYLIG